MSIAYINTEPRTERDSQYFFSAWRVVEIGFFVALHATCFSLAAAGYLILGRRRRLGALFGRSMANLLEALGPTFIKIGQVLSSRPDLLPGEIINALSRLQDEIAPFDVRKIPAIIQQAFGRPVEEIFESLDLDHVSAASVAHVHRARLKDGRKVAVKIRRPGIIRLVDSDLAILRFIAKTLARIPALRTMPLTQLVDDIGTPIRQQLDFVLEAENNRLFHEQFARVEHIRFPRLVEELCTDSVLTMEYLDDLQKVTSSTFAEAERKVAALAGLRALYKMIFSDGFIHADMHPGNVFVREWGEFVILDTGLVARLSPPDMKDFVDFFFGLINNDGKECARIVYETALYRTSSCDRQLFEAAMIDLIARHSSLKSREFEVTRFVYQLIETQRRFGICGSTKFMMTILSMVVFDGICKQLYPECDFQAEARGFLIVARYRRMPHRPATKTIRASRYEKLFASAR